MTSSQARAGRRIGERDAALRRLRRLTALALAGAGAFAALFAGLAAKAFSGHSAATTHRAVPRVSTTPARAVATPPPLVSDGSAAAAAPAAPAQAPVQTSAPPVVVSGGS
jgi:hypothetical protein